MGTGLGAQACCSVPKVVDRSGDGMSWAQCATCGETFNSDSGFDPHLIRTDNRCLTVPEMTAQGWGRNSRGWWFPPITAAAAISQRARFGREDSTRIDREA